MADGRSPEETFAIHLNKALAKGLNEDADPDVMARVCLNTARELCDHYGAGSDHANYQEFVVDAQFEQAEIEAFLDALENNR
jgi:hypothetical protein